MEDSVIHIDVEKMMLTSKGKVNLEIKADISKGDFVTFFGPSGAGKTTLLRIIAGLVRPDKGRIYYGNSVWFDSEKKLNISPQQRNTGFMFQDYALFPNMTIKENVQFAFDHKDINYTNELLHIFGLDEFRNHRPSGLSGGQRQRVALARALAKKPKLLLLDEPLSAVGPSMRSALQDEIAKAHLLSGATTVLVSHDLPEVFKLSKKVYILESGKILKQGDSFNVFTDNKISGKFQFAGEIIQIDKEEVVNIVTVMVGNNIVKVIAADEERDQLQVGNKVILVSKAFNPMIIKI
jgi:molybdate transport system ATP-binding protein